MTNFTLTSAIGVGKYKLNAFDNALLKSGMGDFNLVKISSILPPNCQMEAIHLKHGDILHAAYSSIFTKTPGERVTAVIAVGIPNDGDSGVIMEHSGSGDETQIISECIEMVEIAFQSRGRTLKEIKTTHASCVCENESYHCAFAAIAIW